MPAALEVITLESLDEHVYELFVDRAVPDSDLGMIKKGDHVDVPVGNEILDIRQSTTMLNTLSSSTGAMAWRVTPLFVDWLVTGPCSYLVNQQTTVVELGCGVAGIAAAVIGPKVKRYLATDQRPLLKLCKQNIENNVAESRQSNIEIREFDWEFAAQMIGGLDLTGVSPGTGLIIACDTIYNDYLVPHFVDALKALGSEMKGATILVAQQLRSELVLEAALRAMLMAGFSVQSVPETQLSAELARGYAVHLLTFV